MDMRQWMGASALQSRVSGDKKRHIEFHRFYDKIRYAFCKLVPCG